MKNLNLIERLLSYSHEKQSPQRFARYAAMLIMLLTLGVGQMWADACSKGQVFYFRPSTSNKDWTEAEARFAVCFQDKYGDSKYEAWYSCIEVPGDAGTYYAIAPEACYKWFFCRMDGSKADNNWDNKWAQSTQLSWNGTDHYNLFTRKSDGNWDGDCNWGKYAPPMSSVTLTNTSTVYGGDGTSGNPYKIKKGTTLSVSASATPAVDGGYTKYYQFYKKEGVGARSTWGSRTTTSTASVTASSTVGVRYEIDVVAQNEYYSTYGTGATSSTMYFVTVDPIYAILGSFNNWDRSAATWDLISKGSNNWDATFHLDKGNHTFKVVFNSVHNGNGATITRASNSTTGLSSGGSNMTITADVAGDYKFRYNSSSNSLTVTYPTAYTITYGAGVHNGSDAAISVSPSFSSGELVLAETDVTFSKGSTRTGYTWNGWWSSNNGTGTKHSATDGSFTWSATRTGNLSVYACYDLVNYTITYNLNGGANPGGAPTGFTIESSAITLPTPTRTGYTFAGWKLNSDLSGDSYTTIPVKSTGNKVYYAKWTANTYSIHFNGNGSTSGEMSNQTGIAYDSEAAITTNAFVKTGYTFAGWATSQANADAGTVEYTDGQSVSNLSSTQGATVTLYAVWTPNEYTVSFNANGGTGSMSNQGFAYGVAENLQTNTFTKDGYHFDGWAEAADGDVVYEDGADGCRISSTHGATVTLYAHWTKSVLTDITFAPTSAAGKVRITATPVITPTPTGTTQICWTMWSNSACTEKVDTASFTQVGETNAVTFWTPALSGTYYIRAEYKTGSSCGGGTELNSIVRTYVVASEHNVTIKYMYDGMEIASRTQEVIPAADSIEISAPDLDGYTFSSWSLGDVILQAGAAPKPALTSSTIEIKALYDGVVIANYSKKDMIYFNNTLGWEHVYVYFYSSNKYWSDTYGTGAKYSEKFTKDEDTHHKPHYHHYWGKMEQIEGTNVWRFDYQAAAASLTPGNTEINGYTNVVFTKDPQGYGYGDEEKGYQWFHETEVVRRGDFDHGMSMFVPIKDAGETKNASTYYNNGYWMNYPEGSGYTLKVYYNKSGGDAIRSVPFEFNAATKLPSSVTVDLEAKKTYYFEVMSHHVTPKYYGNNGTMTNENNAQEWEFFSADVSRCGITTTAAGDYKFNWSYANGTNGYQYHMEVDYPASNGDYRIKYTDTEHTGVGTSYARYSRVINKRKNGIDTVSFFIATDKTPTFAIEYITGITNEGVISWSAVAGKSVTTTAVDGAKVYNIRIEQDADGNITSAAVIGAYTGNYYIRTDCASSQWNNYRYDPGNLMTYSDYATNKTGSDYTHYFMAHANAGTNVKFVIANDYSAYLTDTLYQSSYYRGGDALHVTTSGSLNAEANIRFMWDMRDNKVIRAYLAAAKSNGSKFLVLQGTSGNIADENGTPLSNENGNNHGAGDDAIQFIDKENWIYETTVQVVPSSFVKLYALYNGATFYYYGNEGGFDNDHAIQLVTGSGSAQKVKVVYDFKTDRLVAAWQPPVSAIESPTPINADVMLVRNHQDAGQNIRFTESGALTDVKTVYGVMQFNRWTLNNRDGEDDVDPNHCKSEALIAEYHPLLPANQMKSDYERFNYFISFPFDVKVGDIFGFGTYGRHWVIKYYDGLGRATNGYWADSESNWKYITNTDEVLHAYQGYLLKLSVSRMAYDNEEVWTNNSSIMELYFPSNGSIGSITQKNETIPALGAEYECTINRGTGTDGDRRVKDSYWRCIGVPSFADYSATLSDGSSTIEWTTGSTLPYLYEWIMETNHLQPQSTSSYSFEAMKAYLVQYAGQIIFSNVSAKNSVVARHRDASEITNAEWKLTLSQDDKVVDQAFVRLSDNENVTANFDFNQDLTKELNTGSNLYTLIGYEKAAANCLPLTEQTTIVPIGIVAASNGDYTFAIPEGTNGVGVTLIDNETGIRTILSALDYTVSLSSGTYNDRFYLEISPIRPISTGVEEVTGDGLQVTGARKVLIDGLLYIVKDGKVFDAQGKRLQ